MTAKQLVNWRRRMGWTQEQAARALDMTPQHYARMERDVQPIRQVVALACRALTADTVLSKAAGKKLPRKRRATEGRAPR